MCLAITDYVNTPKHSSISQQYSYRANKNKGLLSQQPLPSKICKVSRQQVLDTHVSRIQARAVVTTFLYEIWSSGHPCFPNPSQGRCPYFLYETWVSKTQKHGCPRFVGVHALREDFGKGWQGPTLETWTPCDCGAGGALATEAAALAQPVDLPG